MFGISYIKQNAIFMMLTESVWKLSKKSKFVYVTMILKQFLVGGGDPDNYISSQINIWSSVPVVRFTSSQLSNST